jgi:response regulator RpfG family c-di-GMP phosphodiesterase
MTKSDLQVVVVDDEKYICSIIEESLASEDFRTVTFTDPREALDYIENNSVDLVLTDLMMGDCTGVDVLEFTLQQHPDAIVIIMTAHPTVQTAISVLKKGGYDFLVKPFKLEVLRATIKRSLTHQRLLRENMQLKSQVEFLKAAHTYGVGSDVVDYLKLVLSSCRTEFSANAAALVELDPVSGEITRKLSDSDNEAYKAEVENESHLAHFIQTTNSEPYLKYDDIVIDNQPMCKTFISKPVLVGDKLHGIINLLVIDRFHRVTPGELDVLSILTNSAAMALTNYGLYVDVQKSYLEAITGLAHAIEARDECTKGHTDRVVTLATIVAEGLGWSDQQLDSLVMGCTLHDIGKLGVPDSILNKPGRLDDQELLVMQSHAEVGLKIVAGIDLLKPAIPYIGAHHERYDGKGYPKGLRGEEVPIEGRVLAVVDTFDAILSDRPYRKGAPLGRAISELWNNKGTQFDPMIVDVFLELIKADKIDFKELWGRDEDLSIVDTVMAIETVSV